MRCPIDKSDMIVVEHQKIELDFCLKCAGVWLDSGELNLLVLTLKSEGASITDTEILKPQDVQVTESNRKCPICGRNMNKAWIGKAPKVLIDSCPIGDGLWFDGGELNQVLCEMETPGLKSKNVLSFLGKAFQARCTPEDEISRK
jgi:uncharacterized protein